MNVVDQLNVMLMQTASTSLAATTASAEKDLLELEPSAQVSQMSLVLQQVVGGVGINCKTQDLVSA